MQLTSALSEDLEGDCELRGVLLDDRPSCVFITEEQAIHSRPQHATIDADSQDSNDWLHDAGNEDLVLQGLEHAGDQLVLAMLVFFLLRSWHHVLLAIVRLVDVQILKDLEVYRIAVSDRKEVRDGV